MLSGLTHISLLVKDYDEALEWYTQKLGLEPRSNVEWSDVLSQYGQNYRWVTVSVKGQNDVEVVLHKPYEQEEGELEPLIGKTPGFVFGIDDCYAEVEQLRTKGVRIAGEPETVPWGIQASLEDLYGNIHVLVEPP